MIVLIVPVIKLFNWAFPSMNDSGTISIQIIKYCENLTQLFQKNNPRLVSDINWLVRVLGVSF